MKKYVVEDLDGRLKQIERTIRERRTAETKQRGVSRASYPVELDIDSKIFRKRV